MGTDDPARAGEPLVVEKIAKVSLPTAVGDDPAMAVEKNRLFQTVQETKSSSRNYLKVLFVVCIIVAAAGSVIWFVNRPGPGDKIRVPAAMELAVRDHFLATEKRTATDIAFYQCNGFTWARVGVETRNDIPNPLLRVPTYSARISASGEIWTVSATPITTPDGDVPCK